MTSQMENPPTIFWKYSFLLAGVFNCVAGGCGMGFPELGLKLMTGSEASEPEVLFIFFILCFIVALFGLGYLMVAFDASSNRGLVVVGAISKICLFAMALYGYLNGLATLAFLVVAIGDVIWAGLFAFYLNSTKRAVSRSYI